MPETREDADHWVSACEHAVGVGLSRLGLPVMTMKQRSSDGCEQHSGFDQHGDCGISSLVEDQWQEISFIPVYCGDMMAQLTACSSTKCAAGQPVCACKQTSSERPAAGVGPPSSSALLAPAAPGTPGVMLNVMSTTSAVGRQWGVIDVADLPADCFVSFSPDTCLAPDYGTRASQFHSVCTFADDYQQLQGESQCTLQQQFHSLCLQPQDEQPANIQRADTKAAAATAQSNTQQGGSTLQPAISCQPTAAGSILESPCLNEVVHAMCAPASVDSLDSLALLPLHNPYQHGANSIGLGGLDAAMFMGEF